MKQSLVVACQVNISNFCWLLRKECTDKEQERGGLVETEGDSFLI